MTPRISCAAAGLCFAIHIRESPLGACFLAQNLLLFQPSVSRLKAIRFVTAARVLACVLAGALLLFELLAADNSFHQALHHNGKAASNSCVICLLAKGHADSADTGPVFAAPVRISLITAPAAESIFIADFTYLSFPSRAPPASLSLLSVVA